MRLGRNQENNFLHGPPYNGAAFFLCAKRSEHGRSPSLPKAAAPSNAGGLFCILFGDPDGRAANVPFPLSAGYLLSRLPAVSFMGGRETPPVGTLYSGLTPAQLLVPIMHGYRP